LTHPYVQNKETALLQASYKGHDAVVQLLAVSGANPNAQEKV
jgi:ankyrin repeat protein